MLGAKLIGITMDHTGIHYAAMKKRKAWELLSSGVISIPDGLIIEDHIENPESLSLQLKAWVKANRYRGASTVAAIPTSQIIIRKLKIPTTNRQELQQMVDLEVETTLRLPFVDPVYDIYPVSEDGEGTEVLLYAASKKVVSTYVKVLEDAGLRVMALEFGATALARAIEAKREQLLEETMLVSLEEDALDVYLFQSGNPIFMRTITIYQTEESERGKLTADQTAELIAEISRMLSFYQYSIREGAGRIAQIILTGSSESTEQLCQELKTTLPELQVESMTFDYTTKGAKSEQRVDENRVAVGLSMYKKTPTSINLMPRKQTKKQIRFAAIGALAGVWLLALGGIGYLYISESNELEAQVARLADLKQQIAAVEQQLQSKQGTASISDPNLFIQQMKSKKVDVVAMVEELKAPLPVGAQVVSLSYTANGQFALTAIFPNMKDTAKYLFDLRGTTLASRTSMLSIIESNGISAVEAVNGEVLTNTGQRMYTAVYDIPLKKLDPSVPVAKGEN